ncbi:MAG TPA: LPP20 family lipoprotein [Fibrobacteria bacterium]|nr:LPP20 family lipoprotein [Fibrobacteria bacterium]
MIGPMALLAAATVWAAPPEWAISGKSASHPAGLYVVGAGSSEESIDLARQAAMADVVRQVKARVKSTSEDERWEASSSSAGNSRGESSWSGAKVQASEEITGIQIAETAQDGKIWYALAVLDRSAFAAPGRTAMREAESDARSRWTEAIRAVDKKRPVEALQALRLVEIARSRFLSGRERAALGEPEALSESFSLGAARTDSLRREILRGLELGRPIDSVETGPDRNWPSGAGLVVRFRGAPVAGIEVDLASPTGQILGTAKTDSNGFSAVRPATDPSTTSTGWSRWSLRPRLDVRPSAELGLWVRLSRSDTRVRLDWDGTVAPEHAFLVKNRLAASGWSIDSIRGTRITARFSTTLKGEIQGFSGQLKRMEAKLVLSRGDARCETSGVGTGPTEDKALAAAIERLAFSSDCLKELLAEH